MAYLNGRTYSRRELSPYLGTIEQICGAKAYELVDGKTRGTRAIDVWSGGGLDLTVLPDRGMDIPFARYKGNSLCLAAKPGIVSSAHYEPEGDGWFRSYFAGLLTTCGMSNTGAACEIGGQKYGLHGRISNTPAEKVNILQGWTGDEFDIELRGSMREATFYGENLLLTRHISIRLGENRFRVRDCVENQGYSAVPLMLLYHFNAGFPLLDTCSELLINAASTAFYDDAAASGAAEMLRFQAPTHEYFRQVFLHKLREDAAGRTRVAIVNRRLSDSGLGLYLEWNRRELPEFFTFKMMGEGDYQLGLEPSNCLPMGRSHESGRGGLKMIEPQSTQSFEIEIGVLDGAEEIGATEAAIAALR